jgi:hypothetical protein
MTSKNYDFGEGVCYYYDVSHNSEFEYVKPCESGKHCISVDYNAYDIKKCIDYSFLKRSVNDDCTQNDDCPSNLVCNSSKKCDFDGNAVYSVGNSHYCPSGKVYNTDTYTCETAVGGGGCLARDSNDASYSYAPGYFQYCGYIELKKRTGGDYYENTVKTSTLGSEENGAFVRSMMACKSGAALYFYGNNHYRSSERDGLSSMFLKCVTVKGVELACSDIYCSSTSKIVKYSFEENGSEQYYFLDELSTPYKGYLDPYIDEFTMTRIDIFKNIYKRHEEIKADCLQKLYPDEPYTCRDDELRKWHYFYDNPEKYLMYKDEPQIMEYLVQSKYPSYQAEHTKDSSSFLHLNILLILLLLISF